MVMQLCVHMPWYYLEILGAIEQLLYVCFVATIFAYGQTSSGKTFAMRGITQKVINDIYNHIMNVSFVWCHFSQNCRKLCVHA